MSTPKIAACLAFAGAMFLAGEVSAKPKAFVGTWRGIAQTTRGRRQKVRPGMKIIFEFTAKGQFVASMTMKGRTKRSEGSWKLKRGGLLVTVTERGKARTKRFAWRVRGRHLQLIERFNKFDLVRVR